MEWYNILSIVFGAIGTIGGLGGIITIYHAKSNKDTIDIANFHSLLEEERLERANLRQEYEEYKESVNKRVAEVKMEVEKIKEERNKMLAAIYRAYRCPLPEKLDECPVIKAYQDKCEACCNPIE